MELKYSFSNQILSSHEMKDLELKVCATSGKNLADLMEAAGAQVAAFIQERYDFIKTQKLQILILSGPGNNGGDGLVVGRLLREAGFVIQVVLLGASKYSRELQQQIETFQSNKIPLDILVEHQSDQTGYISTSDLPGIISKSALVVEALLGTGQRGAPHGLVKSTCEALNSAVATKPTTEVISIDVPCGIDCDNGEVFESHISPNATVVIQHLKRGLVQLPALDRIGDLILVDAGIENDQLKNISRYSLLSEGQPILEIKPRPRNAHKKDFGHILIVAGSPEMPGAAELSAYAALRSGAGLVTQLAFENNFSSSYPELMYFRTDLSIGSELAQKIIARIDDFTCLLIGPGLGQSQAVTSFVFELLRAVQLKNIACIVDADGLNAMSELLKLNVPLHLPSAILTPHPGEAARLLQISTQQVQAKRFEATEKISEICQATVVLKGASTICFDGKKGVVNTSGGPFLATAGSGDVLAGMIAAFIASGRINSVSKSLAAASLGVYLHGVAGELAHNVHSGPIIASDIIEKIPYSIGQHVSART